ncbi:MAG: hypothetical protein AAF514_20005, partial [Verrucomicrobiota bacterium]
GGSVDGSRLPFQLSMGRDQIPERLNRRQVANMTWSPVKLATGSLADAVGVGAWDNMVRRSQLLARGETSVFLNPEKKRSPNHEGAALALLRQLDRMAREQNISLELYGHSMGALVINEMIGGFSRKERKQLGIDRIVFMGAACSIRDFNRTTGEYVSETRTPFYNLSLHPFAEVRESLLNDAGSPFFSGSLLTWIDAMFERPPGFEGRTLGSFYNVVLAKDVLPSGPHVHFKAFGASPDSSKKGNHLGPQKHGEFDDYQFWNEAFLQPSVDSHAPNHTEKDYRVLWIE